MKLEWAHISKTDGGFRAAMIHLPFLRVHALVFVADSADRTEDTLDLFRQLVNAPWVTDSVIFLAFTKVCLLSTFILLCLHVR